MAGRELLELAAKAAGYQVDTGFADCPLIYGEDAGVDGPREWNPLTDDGDALRLAVKLRLDIMFFEGFQEVHSSHCMVGEGENWESYGDDPLAATRRSIVRAAAEIGKSLEEENV